MKFHGQKSSPWVADILAQHGIQYAIICPGSRSAPLTLAFSRHGNIECLSIVDERSAGYFALGLAIQKNQPVALICTSGTATLNFAPAIAEAFYLNVPLLILTADRPESSIGQMDGQAILQKNVYQNFCNYQYHLHGELFNQNDLDYTQRIVNDACNQSINFKTPVHINFSYSEPLYENDYKRVNSHFSRFIPSIKSFFNWTNLLDSYRNVYLVIGQLINEEIEKTTLDKIGELQNVILIHENLSNIPKLKNSITNIPEVVSLGIKLPNADVIIYLGGSIVAKKTKQFLSSSNVPAIRIDEQQYTIDTFGNTVTHLDLNTQQALNDISEYYEKRKIKNEFAEEWVRASQKATEKTLKYIQKAEFSDLKVISEISKMIPEFSSIHFGNSTPVRYAQLMKFNPNCKYYSNRGTSGIDGVTSTAFGFSYKSTELNFLITGDISFQYDSNAFFNSYGKENLKIIVINNSGGNIFKVIEGARDQKEVNTFFETSTQHEFSNLAKHFQLNYYKANSLNQLKSKWENFIYLENNKPSILEIFTDAETSANTFRSLYTFLKK